MHEKTGLSGVDDAQMFFLLENTQDLSQVVTALHDHATRGNNGICALLAGKLRVFFDAVERHLGGPSKHRKNRPVVQEIDSIITPFPISDHEAIEAQYRIKFSPVEGYNRSGRQSRLA